MYPQAWAQCLEDVMQTVGIRELKQRASELIRLVREEGSLIQISSRGQVVAMLIPVARPTPKDEDLAWAEIGARLPAGIPAAEAVAESRR
jgi:prevent-host-death family protein